MRFCNTRLKVVTVYGYRKTDTCGCDQRWDESNGDDNKNNFMPCPTLPQATTTREQNVPRLIFIKANLAETLPEAGERIKKQTAP